MGFKSLYLAEKVNVREMDKLINIISGVANKEATDVQKRKHGSIFAIPVIGSWSTFADKLKIQLEQFKWNDESETSTDLKFTRQGYTLYALYKNSSIAFYLTDKKNQEPEWDEETDK
jgi:hypothetical protein